MPGELGVLDRSMICFHAHVSTPPACVVFAARHGQLGRDSAGVTILEVHVPWPPQSAAYMPPSTRLAVSVGKICSRYTTRMYLQH